MEYSKVKYSTIKDAHIVKHARRIPFVIDHIDWERKKIIHGVICYYTMWEPTFFSNRQLNQYKKNIDHIIAWFQSDIQKQCKLSNGLLIIWKDTYETSNNLNIH